MLTSQKQKMAALAAVETQLASFCDCKGDLGAGPPGLARTQAHVNRTEPLCVHPENPTIPGLERRCTGLTDARRIARLLRTADDDAPSAFRNADVAIDSVYYDGDLDCGRRVVNRAFEHEGDDEWFGAEIGEADVMRDVVVCELVAAISRTYDQLALGVRHVRDVEVDVLHAGAQAALARAKLARARKDTVTDVVVLLRLRQRRERYAAVVDVAKRCVAAKQALEEIYDAAADGDLSRAVELTWDASVALRDKDLKDLRVLDGARRRTDGVVPTLRAAVDHALRRCIDDEEFDASDYAEVIKANTALEDLESSSSQSSSSQPALPRDGASFARRASAHATERFARAVREGWRGESPPSAEAVLAADALAFDADAVAVTSVRLCGCAMTLLALLSDGVEWHRAKNGADDFYDFNDDDESESDGDAASEEEEAAGGDEPSPETTESSNCVSPSDDDGRGTEEVAAKEADGAAASSEDGAAAASEAPVVDPAEPAEALVEPATEPAAEPAIEPAVLAVDAVLLADDAARAGAAESAWWLQEARLQETREAFRQREALNPMRRARHDAWRLSWRIIEANVAASVADLEGIRPRLEDVCVATLAAKACVELAVARGAEARDAADLKVARLDGLARLYLEAQHAEALLVLEQMLECEPWCPFAVEADLFQAFEPQALRTAVNKLVSASDSYDDFETLRDRAFRAAPARDEGEEVPNLAALSLRADVFFGERFIVAGGGSATQAAFNGVYRAVLKYACATPFVGGPGPVVEKAEALVDAYVLGVAGAFVPLDALRGAAALADGGDSPSDCECFAPSDADSLRSIGAFLAPHVAAGRFTSADFERANCEKTDAARMNEYTIAAQSLAFVVDVARSASSNEHSHRAKAAAELRALMFRALGRRLADGPLIISAILSADKWQAEEIQEDHNAYVDDVGERLEAVWAVAEASVADAALREEVWGCAAQACYEALVDGFARVVCDGCSTEGRALMSMDLQVMQYSLDKVRRARPPRAAPYVNAFIKSTYLPEADLDEWLRDHAAGYLRSHTDSLRRAAAPMDRPTASAKKKQGRLVNFLHNSRS